MIYKPTEAYNKILAVAGRPDIKTIACEGGQGASKTVSIVMLAINECLHYPNYEASILGHELTKLKSTVVNDFIKIMKSWRRFNMDQWIRGSYYKFKNGSYMQFLGLDKHDIGKGFRRDLLYFNEANRGITFETYHQAASRARHKVFLDWNPDFNFWGHREVVTEDDAELVRLTYADNEYLPAGEKKVIEGYYYKGYNADGTVKNEYWANKWRVYGLGLVGKVEGLVFPNCQTFDYDFTPEVYGLDFGYNDPTALIGLGMIRGRLLGKQILYRRGMSNKNISDAMEALGLNKWDEIVADSADPKSIAELQSYGWNIIPAVKGPDSIAFGIQRLNELDINIHYGSHDWVDESNSYKYHMKDGQKTNKPIDNHNHCWDSARYACMHKYGNIIASGYGGDYDAYVG